MKSVISLFLVLLLETETQCGPYHFTGGLYRPMYMREYHRRFRPYGFFDRSRYPPFFFQPPIGPDVAYLGDPMPFHQRLGRGPNYRTGFISPGALDFVARRATEARSNERVGRAREVAPTHSHSAGHLRQTHAGNSRPHTHQQGEGFRPRVLGINRNIPHSTGGSSAHVGQSGNTHQHVHTPSKTARHSTHNVRRTKQAPPKKNTSHKSHPVLETAGHVGHAPGEHVGPVLDIFGNDLHGQDVGHAAHKVGQGKQPSHDHSHVGSIQSPKSAAASPEPATKPTQTNTVKKSDSHDRHVHIDAHAHGELLHHGHSPEDHVGPVVDIYGKTHEGHSHHPDKHSNPSNPVKIAPVAKKTVRPLPVVPDVGHHLQHTHHSKQSGIHSTPTPKMKQHRITHSIQKEVSPKPRSVDQVNTFLGEHADIEVHAHGDLIHVGHSAEDHVGPVVDIFGRTHNEHSHHASANDPPSGSVKITSGVKTTVQSLPVGQHGDHQSSHSHHNHHPNEINKHPPPTPKRKQHRIEHFIRKEVSPKIQSTDPLKILHIGNEPKKNGDAGTLDGIPVGRKARLSRRLNPRPGTKESIFRRLSDLIADALIRRAQKRSLREQNTV